MTRDDIEAAYDRLGYKLGWRFLTGPARNVETADVAVVTLNPSGNEIHGPNWSQEEGSAYVVESWRGLPAGSEKLQVQVQRMCALLGVEPAEVLSAHFVPFRSPRWDDLERQDEAVAFARTLWTWLLSRTRARTIVCVGRGVVETNVASIISARLDAELRTEWGEYKMGRYKASDGRVLLGLPHLSTFKRFGKPERDRAFLSALDRTPRAD